MTISRSQHIVLGPEAKWPRQVTGIEKRWQTAVWEPRTAGITRLLQKGKASAPCCPPLVPYIPSIPVAFPTASTLPPQPTQPGVGATSHLHRGMPSQMIRCRLEDTSHLSPVLHSGPFPLQEWAQAWPQQRETSSFIYPYSYMSPCPPKK